MLKKIKIKYDYYWLCYDDIAICNITLFLPNKKKPSIKFINTRIFYLTLFHHYLIKFLIFIYIFW